MTTLQCSYCSLSITDDSYLHCVECGGDVHNKCLSRCTPGDLLGDVFFDFTCAKCMQLQYDGPSTSSEVFNGVLEKFVRQRMSWLLVITLTLYNLSIKSKGLSRNGYFHWRTHIVNFIDKNWEYLFDPTVKRRKKWTGSISGALSHNSPQYFTSGQELFEETGWWKLTHDNKTPKYIFNLYELQCLKRQQIRNDKRQLDDAYDSDKSNNDLDSKRFKTMESEDEDISQYTCSRMIPYMGRKPKLAKQLDVLDDDHLLGKMPQNSLLPLDDPSMSLNTVQSSLMDFLAESLASDDLNMFNTLPNIASEPLVEPTGKNDILPSLLAHSNDNANFFENPAALIKTEPMDLNGHLYSDLSSQLLLNEKLKSFYSSTNCYQQQDLNPLHPRSDHTAGIAKNISENMSFASENSIQTPPPDTTYLENAPQDEKYDSSPQLRPCTYDEDSDTGSDEFSPRIVQVTNFQQLPEEDRTKNSNKFGKQEKHLAANTSSSELKQKQAKAGNKYLKSSDDEEDENEDHTDNDIQKLLKDCKPSLFTKQPRRQWPWLVEKTIDNPAEENSVDLSSETVSNNNADLTRLSEYEEKELLKKLRRIFALEDKCKIQIPSYVRRFYQKLCIREWKRSHGKVLFNLDDYINDRQAMKEQTDKVKHIDRYQLLTQSSGDNRRSFHARIVGTFQCEFFESPYTQRVLHPYIYRNSKYFPPFLKLMCELQYKVNNKYPSRAPIDFCYVRPNHIAAVNSLLQTVFWPGIDMSECLSYPDYSVVALYKKLVVGCGFLVPDVGFNEAYISFMAVRPGWQRSGIGTFMLYHLIQTCMTKDITLHVSATNPAVVLYQKFGFKMEEVVLNFYDKYLPFESTDSRHALFLRLSR
ncbi:cysteine-rich protein 2-binding protein [Stomoxys calcitrans]|uniref:cysteine-rich protein 2-binding protein n=1 Tax=Stomoxys calcitrans TaxID=35570 RepID=UPI0027E3A428|nr:cysteine-rich protein 2-binding protein [Stomoxys calcitrans]